MSFVRLSLCLTVLILHSGDVSGKSPSAAPAGDLSGAKATVFKTVGGSSLRLYAFNPLGHQASDSRPAILLFFGGGWERGDPSQFVKHAAYLTSRGIVAICPEYRTRSSHGTSPLECVADGKSAMRWVRLHAKELGIDPKRIAAGGGSAGGHVAVSTAVLNDMEEPGADTSVSCIPDALVLFNPVVDTTAKGYGAKKLGSRNRDASPVDHVRAGLPPTIIFHGKADKTVPYENAQRFTDAMKKAGNTCTLFGYDGEDHGFYRKKEKYYTDTLSEVDKFLVSLGWLPPLVNVPATSPLKSQ